MQRYIVFRLNDIMVGTFSIFEQLPESEVYP